MAEYGFRLRFQRCQGSTLEITSPCWQFAPSDSEPSVQLTSPDRVTPIRDSDVLVLKSDGWATSRDAEDAATRYVTALTLALARLRIGVDYGDRAPKSGFFRPGLQMLEAQTGNRVLNDVHGLMIYELVPGTLFARLPQPRVTIGINAEKFESAFSQALATPVIFSETEDLAIQLFNSSFFQMTTDSRFLMLMMALEALLNPAPRSVAARAHLDELARQTQGSSNLSQDDKHTLLQALRGLN